MALTDSLLTAAARRHAARMTRALAPAADRLERRFRALLRKRRYDAAQIRALLAITPAAASRLRSLGQFLEQVGYNGRRLARLNVAPAEVAALLGEFGRLLEEVLAGRFQPAREQVHLATIRTIEGAYYQVRELEAQAFFGLYRAESEARDLDDLLRRFMRVLTHAFHARAGRLLLGEGPAGGKRSRPLYIERGQPQERLIADPHMRGRYASYWSYPLRSGALMQFGFRLRYPWLPRELALLQAAAERCQAAIDRVRMQQEVQRLEAEAHRAEEEERRRIGRELHDEAGQSLLLLRLELEMMEREAPPALRARLRGARAVAERTVTGLRRIIAALGPAALDRLGLAAALRRLAARFRKVHGARLSLRIPAASGQLPRYCQEVIYRVAQESLQNIAKHSQATHVNLSLHAADRGIRLRVTDNGAGFCAEAAWAKPMSFGLAGMRERARLLGGTLAVRSVRGKGTAVTLELPPSARVARNGKNTHPVD